VVQRTGKIGWVKNSKISHWLEISLSCGQYQVTIGQSTFVPVGKHLCVYDFSLARNTIVVWTIQSCHWAKHLRSGLQALQCIGTKQITSVYALSGNFFYCPFFDCK